MGGKGGIHRWISMGDSFLICCTEKLIHIHVAREDKEAPPPYRF